MAWVLLGVAFLALVPSTGLTLSPGAAPSATRVLFYELQRDRRKNALLRSVSDMATLESRRFILHYDEELDAAWAPAVLECADGAREAVSRRMGWSVLGAEEKKAHIILYPDYEPLAKQFGGASFRALGAYWCEVIQLLSPRVWLGPAPSQGAARLFWTNGPLVHEYTHYVLDQLIPAGNYPRWLSEGLAQYVEYKETGYVWLDEANVIKPPVRSAVLYSLEELQRGFDSLPNTALAYRQAFLLTAYLEDSVGWTGINQFLFRLANLESFAQALQAVTGLSPAEFEQGWLDWLDLTLGRPPLGLSPGEEGSFN
jgi:hypothetical protein